MELLIKSFSITLYSPSRRSLWGLNAVNFFLAQVAAVVVPFLNIYLRARGWRYDEIGAAVAISGLGSFLLQIPAGIICDNIKAWRALLALVTLVLGLCFGLMPYLAHSVVAMMALQFISGIAGCFLAPLIASLALSLVGRIGLDNVLGKNHSWNHLGNVLAAIMALIVVKEFGIEPLFYIAAIVSVLAASSLVIIRREDLHPIVPVEAVTEVPGATIFRGVTRKLLAQTPVRVLLLSVTLYYVANGASGPLVSLYLKHLNSPDSQVAWIVLIAQPIMIPVSWLAGKYGGRFGRKAIFGIAFLLLPIRLALFGLATQPEWVLAIQALDGIIAGIFGVLIVLVCSDLTRGKSGFNALMGLVHAAPALGALIGAALQGFFTQWLGFERTFFIFSLIALSAALIFLILMPETHEAHETKKAASSAAS